MPPTPIFEICQELWIEGDQAALSVPPCVHLCIPRLLGQAGGGRAHPAGARMPRALRSRRSANPPSVACAAPFGSVRFGSVRTVVITGVPFPCLPAGVMGLQALGKVRYLIHPRSRTSDYISRWADQRG